MGKDKAIEAERAACAWAFHRVKLNPDRSGGRERVVFSGVEVDGHTLEISTGEVVTLSHETWAKVKELSDAQGRKYLVRA